MSTSELTPYEAVIAKSWTETHKKAALMTLILLALRDKPAWSSQIKAAVAALTNGNLQFDDQSLHRSLRRLEDHNLLIHTQQAAPGTGAKRKVYELTQSGERILRNHLATTMSYTRLPTFQSLGSYDAGDPPLASTSR
jgi:DNA-binding PadR family transcriptional regulator